MKIRKVFPRRVREIVNQWIPLPDGVRLAARIWLPRDAQQNPVPAILEYIPYRKRDGTAVRDQLTHPYLAGHGYAAVRVDLRGTGESEGIFVDEYTTQEQDDAVSVIEWLARQPWCTGMVGMMGISWGGFNSLQVAARRPSALKAIVSLCSTDDRYADDIHYKGGCNINENLGWSATMFAYASRPPDPKLVGRGWKKMWLARLNSEPLLITTWLRHPNRDGYWRHGSICEDWRAIEAATLLVGGWNDAYSNAVPRMIAKLKAPARAIIGPWAHKYPHFAMPEPRIGFLQEALRWWDHWLKGLPTGVIEDPPFRTYIMNLPRPHSGVKHLEGRWVADRSWPADHHRIERLHLNRSGLSPLHETADRIIVSTPQTLGVDGGEYCIIWLGAEFPGDQRRDDSCSVTFDGQPLVEDIDIVGAAVIHLTLRSNKPVAFVSARLNSIWPDGAVSRISYQVMNLTHRNGHEMPSSLEPGKSYAVKIVLDDTAVRVPKGHRLRVSLSTTYWPLLWPAPEAAELIVETGTSFIEIPIRTASELSDPAFAEPESAPPLRRRTLAEPWNKRQVTTDLATGETRLEITDDFGRHVNLIHGLETWERGRETYSIRPDDPLSARQECHWTEELARPGWRVRTETWSELTASKTHWQVSGRLEAYRGKKKVLVRNWRERIERKLG
jgi:putative CocE/NonD family hydrolase